MKVKISYTIDDGEIPKELVKFLNKANEELLHRMRDVQKISDMINDSYDYNDLEKYYNSVGQIRKNMISIDTIMSDCQDIFLGVNQIIEQQRQEAVTSDQQMTAPPVQPPEPQEEVIHSNYQEDGDE